MTQEVFVPGPVRTEFRTELSPQQERIVEKRIDRAERKAGVLGIVAGFIIALVLGGLIYIRGFRKGELYDARMIRRTL